MKATPTNGIVCENQHTPDEKWFMWCGDQKIEIKYIPLSAGKDKKGKQK